VPYSFLTYQDHLPSRHTYLASVGLAALVGILFAAVHERLASTRSREVLAAFLLAVVIGNGAYIWLKKEPQYRERAAPTRELIRILNENDAAGRGLPVYVCDFPLGNPWWFGDTVSRFTPLEREDVVLRKSCDRTGGSPLLVWNSGAAQYASRTGDEPERSLDTATNAAK
jgi:hypothetical protein